jgi:predicted amidohydrolase YtcJ
VSVIFLNGRIYTGGGDGFADALVAKHGRIAGLGGASGLRREYPEARTIDLRGGLMLPGFTDAHVHFLWWAIQQQRLDLSEARTLEVALAKVEAEARTLPNGAWILGGRFDKNLWGRWPTRGELDRASQGRVAVLRSKDGHSRWANSAALRVAGIGRDTPTPEGGKIDRDASGEPTGIVRENASRLLDAIIPQPTRSQVLSALRTGAFEALKRGLTGIHDLDNPMADAHRGFQELFAAKQMSIRVHMGIPHSDLDAALALGIRTGLGSEWLQWSNLKIFSDGALGSQTAALEEPYLGTDDRGVLTIDPERLKRDVVRAADGGIAVAIHAIGDRAVRVSLDAIQAADGSRDDLLRHRLEHIQLIRDEDVERFASLGVTASMQPIHATSDRDIADRHWGERCRRAYVWRRFRQEGVTLAFGSDAPVEPIDPLLGIHAAVTRKRPNDAEPWYPEQCLDLPAAIDGYTLGPAYAVGRERELGTLEVGKWCDAVVLDRDLFEEGSEAILHTNVRATITAGEVRYESGLG